MERTAAERRGIQWQTTEKYGENIRNTQHEYKSFPVQVCNYYLGLLHATFYRGQQQRGGIDLLYQHHFSSKDIFTIWQRPDKILREVVHVILFPLILVKSPLFAIAPLLYLWCVQRPAL